MTLIAVASAKGSPGVTTLCYGLAWHYPISGGRIIVEADPDGGVIAARRGCGFEPGLIELAAAVRRGGDAEPGLAAGFAQILGGQVLVIPAPASPEQVHAALTSSAAPMAKAVSALPMTSFVDLGRVSARSPSLEFARRSVVTLLLVRPELSEIQHLPSRIETLQRAGGNVELVCVGHRPYDPVDVADHVGLPLFGVWPDDAEIAGTFWHDRHPSKRVARSAWWRSTYDLALSLGDRFAPLGVNEPDDKSDPYYQLARPAPPVAPVSIPTPF